MKVQEIRTADGPRWIILDKEYAPVTLFNRYLKFLDNLGRSQNTLLAYARHLCAFGTYMELKGIDILNISTDPEEGPLDILAGFLLWLEHPIIANAQNVLVMNEVQDERKPSTINVMVNTVLGFYDYLARDRIADPLAVYREGVSPSKFKSFLYEMVVKKHVIKKSLFHVREEQRKLEYITPELYRQILGSCHTWRDKAIVGIMYEGGLRLGETLGLHVEDLEIWNSKINIVPRENNINFTFVKRKAAGYVYLPNDVFELISAYCVQERQKYSSEYLFLNLQGENAGLPLRPDTIEKLFDRISNDLGTSIHPHMCRHGCATARLEAGWDEVSIKNQLRHASLSSTRIYEHFRDELLKEKSRKFYEKRNQAFGWSSPEEENR